MEELTQKDMERKIQKKLSKPITIRLDIRHMILILLIIGVLMYSSLLFGARMQHIDDQQVLINVLAWWKVQKDCTTCDAFTCMQSNTVLNYYNLSALSGTTTTTNN